MILKSSYGKYSKQVLANCSLLERSEYTPRQHLYTVTTRNTQDRFLPALYMLVFEVHWVH